MAKQLIKEAYRMQQLAGLINENYVDLRPINSPFMENDDDDSDDVESSEVEYDFTSPGKKDEFDPEDDIEPTSKDVKAGDALAKTAGGKQGKFNAFIALKDKFLNQWKSGDYDKAAKKLNMSKAPGEPEIKASDIYKQAIGDIPMQIKQLQADIDSDLTIDDEDEY